MADVEEAKAALDKLAARLASADPAAKRKVGLDRTIACHLTDLDATFTGRLVGGEITELVRNDGGKGKIGLRLTSADLVALANGELGLTGAWSSGRVKIDASVFDLMKLRSLF